MMNGKCTIWYDLVTQVCVESIVSRFLIIQSHVLLPVMISVTSSII
jgi:hypothetical protein